MKLRSTAQRALLLATALGCGVVMAQPARTDLGKREYDANCAVCHGKDGKGNGAYADMLRKSAPDLTTMARRNAGVFPVARTYEVIEGSGVGHGTRDMPIWGQDYNVKAAEYYMDVPYDPQAYVRGRILALVEYLNRLQVK
jgi:mono/diheme cytochrome c family protein